MGDQSISLRSVENAWFFSRKIRIREKKAPELHQLRGFCITILSILASLRLHVREEDDVADGVFAGEEHDHAVDADAEAGAGGHAVFERAEEVFVHDHRFVVAALAEAGLLFEAFALDDRVVQLGEAVAHLLAADDQLEALDEPRLRAVFFCERRHLLRVVGDEGRLNELRLDELAEDFIDDLAAADLGIEFESQIFRDVAELFFRFAANFHAGELPDRVGDGEAAERRLEVDLVAEEHGRILAVHFHARFVQ